MSKIQTYVDIYDITPTETYWDEVTDNVEPKEFWTRENLVKDIKDNGFKYALKINKRGAITNGNMRYWVARQLLEEGDERFRYLPVELEMFSGIAIMKTTDKITNILVDQTLNALINTKVETIEPRTTFLEYVTSTDDPKKLDDFRKIRETMYDIIPFRANEINHLLLMQVTSDEYDRRKYVPSRDGIHPDHIITRGGKNKG